MIFPQAIVEKTLYIDEMFRIDASKSFTSPDEAPITKVEIRPDGSNWYDVTGSSKDDWQLDWVYSVTGNQFVDVRVTTDGPSVDKTYQITVVNETTEPVLSHDEDLALHESDILSYLPVYKNTYISKHKLARDRILAYLDEHRIWATDGSRLTIAELTDKQEFKEWSKFETLMIIYQNLSNQIDDIFSRKADVYQSLRDQARNRAALRLDRNKDNVTDSAKVDNISSLLVRR